MFILSFPTMTRRSDRTAPPATAWIVINGRADRECSLLDVSPAAAKVVVQDDSDTPERFELAFFHALDKRRKCEVIWRRGKMLGIRFVS
jgi:PilZ domain